MHGPAAGLKTSEGPLNEGQSRVYRTKVLKGAGGPAEVVAFKIVRYGAHVAGAELDAGVEIRPSAKVGKPDRLKAHRMLLRLAPAGGMGILRVQIGCENPTALGGEIGGQRLAPDAEAHPAMAFRQETPLPKRLTDENMLPGLPVIPRRKGQATSPIGEIGLIETLLAAAS